MLSVVEQRAGGVGAPWVTNREGRRVPSNESGARTAQILAGLDSSRCRFHRVRESQSPGVASALAACHDAGYLRSLRRHSSELGEDEVAMDPRYCRPGEGPHMPIFRGAFEVAYEGAAVALEASQLLVEGTPAAYAACRPPGHHAGPDWLGGYCYLNNAMVAVQHLQNAGWAPLALLDLDFHFGDGSSAMARRMDDLLYGSIHTSAVTEYPWRRDEPFERRQLLISAAASPTVAEFVAMLEELLRECANRAVQAIVVSLGYDLVEGDPHGKWALPPSIFAQIGARLVETGLPVCFVQEGGYAVDQLAECAGRLAAGVADAG
jgi:acetoin utilization deacetylase AcuC-like enzyme